MAEQMEPIIVHLGGLWSHPKYANGWTCEALSKATGMQVEVFDYDARFKEKTSDQEYLEVLADDFTEKYAGRKVILSGHSHGGALAIYLSMHPAIKEGVQKLCLTSPCFRPYAVVRQIPTAIKKIGNKIGIGETQKPRFLRKNPNATPEEQQQEIKERKDYWFENASLIRDGKRTRGVGIIVEKMVAQIDVPVVVVQGTKDEFNSVQRNLNAFDGYNKVKIDENDDRFTIPSNKGERHLIVIDNGEHAILEERPDLVEEIGEFIKK